jgi:hypothetical protein
MFLLSLAFLAASTQVGKGLTADLVVTNQPGTLFMRWQKGESFELPNVKTARRGEPVAALVLFSGCVGDKQGQCDVRMDMTILDPAGKTYGESKDAEVWTGKPAPSPGTTQMSVGYMMIRIERKDLPGAYRVKAHVVDRVAAASVDREWSFEVPPLMAKTDSTVWPADRPKPNLAGFWKDHCDDDFGLKIAGAGGELYSISFCGPGGCFDPGTYRPNSPIFGDESYRVVDANTLEVLGGDGFAKYSRCPAGK